MEITTIIWTKITELQMRTQRGIHKLVKGTNVAGVVGRSGVCPLFLSFGAIRVWIRGSSQGESAYADWYKGLMCIVRLFDRDSVLWSYITMAFVIAGIRDAFGILENRRTNVACADW